MISGRTSRPRRFARTAASKIARPCMSVISGIGDAEAAPAMPEHGVRLAQRIDDVRFSSSRGIPSVRARQLRSPRRRAGETRATAGRAAGSSPAARSSPRRCPRSPTRCIGSSLASARRRPASSRATIISRIAPMRSPSKNMCSVRQRPMPSAPNPRAMRASLRRVGVRANAQAAHVVGPAEQSRERLIRRRRARGRASRESPARLRSASWAGRRR